MAENSTCVTCYKKIGPSPQEIETTLRDIVFAFRRGNQCSKCARKTLEKVFTTYGTDLISITEEGLEVSWSNFTGSSGQLLILLSAGLLTRKSSEKFDARVKTRSGMIALYASQAIYFARPQDATAYGIIIGQPPSSDKTRRKAIERL